MIPEGFLHGFVTRAPETEILYKCTSFYNAEADGAVRWDDPEIGVDWGLSGDPILSEKDKSAPYLAKIGSVFWYEGANLPSSSEAIGQQT